MNSESLNDREKFIDEKFGDAVLNAADDVASSCGYDLDEESLVAYDVTQSTELKPPACRPETGAACVLTVF
jgi:hypothetical protein